LLDLEILKSSIKRQRTAPLSVPPLSWTSSTP
jgi:hypothetical protein